MDQADRDLSLARSPSMAERIRQLRRRGFVGRAEERATFRSALGGERAAPRVLLVHGFGGIGKSALLRCFADDARDSGYDVAWLDGERIGLSTATFDEGAAPIRSAERCVLLVDGFEHCQPLEAWLRERFLPTMRDDALLVLAGRQRPAPQWTLDPELRGLVRVLPLEPLKRHEVTILLDERGVARQQQPALWNFAGGHPLALCLAAESATLPDRAGAARPMPDVELIDALVRQLIDRAPSAEHEYGLGVCAHLRHVTVDLLRTGLDENAAVAVFQWLAGLPYVQPERGGLVAHELVRAVLDADFAWRDPVGHNERHLRLWHRLCQRAQSTPGDGAARATAELMYLLQHRNVDRQELIDAVEPEPLIERPYAAELYGELLRMAREDQGDEQARLVAYWLDRCPESFRIHCRAHDLNRVASFSVWLRLRPAVDDFGGDPVLALIDRYLQRQDRHGVDEVGVARFLVPAPASAGRVAGSALHIARMAVQNLRTQDAVSIVFIVIPRAELTVFNVGIFGFSELGELSDASGRTWVLLMRDWRLVSTSSPLHLVASGTQPNGEARHTSTARLSREDHDEAVLGILRHWHDDDAVAANPLVQVYGDSAVVREMVATSIEALSADSRQVKHQRAIRTTYLERTTTQKATAAFLGLPFSTYRRYLTSGLHQLCEHLWRRSTNP